VLIVLSVYILPYVNTRTLEPAAQRSHSAAGFAPPLTSDGAAEPHTTAVPPSAAVCG
jgi:hypothetical protein